MIVTRTVQDLRAAILERRLAGDSVGFVPTMGFLHEGQLSLVRAAAEQNGCVVVSCFVNPTVFSSAEELASYPRDEVRDLALREADPNSGDELRDRADEPRVVQLLRSAGLSELRSADVRAVAEVNVMLVKQAAAEAPELREQGIHVDHGPAPAAPELGQPADAADIQKQIALRQPVLDLRPVGPVRPVRTPSSPRIRVTRLTSRSASIARYRSRASRSTEGRSCLSWLMITSCPAARSSATFACTALDSD